MDQIIRPPAALPTDPEAVLAAIRPLALDDATLPRIRGMLAGALSATLDQPPLAMRIAAALVTRGHAGDTLAHLDAMAGRNPGIIDLQLALVDAEWAAYRGTRFLPQLATLAAESGRKRFAVARRLHRVGRSDEALTLLTAEGGRPAFQLRDRLAEAEILAELRRPDEEDAVLSEALSQWPDDAGIMRAILVSALRWEGADEMLRQYQAFLEGDRQFGLPLRSAVFGHLLNDGFIAAATQFFERDLAPAFPAGRLLWDRCRLDIATGRADAACAALEERSRTQPMPGWGMAEIALAGRAAIGAGRPLLAEATARVGLRITPDAVALIGVLSQSLFRQGRWSDALALLAEQMQRFPAKEALIDMHRAMLLRQGDVPGAMKTLRHRPGAPAAANREMLFAMDLAHAQAGAEDLLRLSGAVVEPTHSERWRRDRHGSEAAILDGDLPTALDRTATAAAAYPDRPQAWKDATRAMMLAGRFDEARAAHGRARAAEALRCQGTEPAREIPDLLLEEIAATGDGGRALTRAFTPRDGETTVDLLMRLLAEGLPPESTVAWTLFLYRWTQTTLARHTEPNARGPSRIPATLLMYWQGPASEPAALCHDAWAAELPSHRIALFDRAKARAWLAERMPEALPQFDAAPGPAVEADIFRLAYLSEEGGVWVDIDERPTAPMAAWLGGETALCLAQERWYGTLGNAFIGAVPKHPVITRALASVLALPELKGGVDTWVDTGPGLMTRTAGRWLWERIRATGTVDGFRILSPRDYCRRVAGTLPFPHKFTDAHWRAGPTAPKG